MKHLCEILSGVDTRKRFKVMYWDESWNELQHLTYEHASAACAYAAVGTWLLCRVGKQLPGFVPPEGFDRVVSVTVEEADG